MWSIDLPPEGVLRCIEQAGIGFCLAPTYHPAFRFAAPSRREIGIPTVFNLLGPMANPGRVRRQLIGVANPAVAERMLASLRIHGSVKAWVVHGNGLDELTTTGSSTVLALEDDHVRTFTVDPVELGLAPAIPDELTGGEPHENAEAVRRVLAGEHGAHRNIVVLNAGAALVVADRAATLEEGIAMAQRVDRLGRGGGHAAALRRRVAGRRRRTIVIVRVPGSSANLGPGFDTLGHGACRSTPRSARSMRRARRCRRVRAPSTSIIRPPSPIDWPAVTGRCGCAAPIPSGRGLGFSGAVRVGGALLARAQQAGRRRA